MPISTNLENIIGCKIPFWIENQLKARSSIGSSTLRSDDILVYLANKSGWVRLISGVDMTGAKGSVIDTIAYNTGVSELAGPGMAQQFVLFGGTSIYKGGGFGLRSGLGATGYGNGAYGMLGDSEVQSYGYSPMPGITSVKIEVQGRLGSLRLATVSFKAHNKFQLDIIDALYFRLGYSMFLEWGSTYFFKSEGLSTGGAASLDSGENYCIDVFTGKKQRKTFLDK